MNFSAEKGRRKWPCVAHACGERLIIAVAAALLVLCVLAEPAAATRRHASWSLRPWGDLFAEKRPKLRRVALPAAVPLPKPRPVEASAPETRNQDLRKQAPAQTAKPAEQAVPAPPPPSACRLALTEEIAIAPSIPDIHGPGGCGGEDLVRLEAVVLPDRHLVSVKPPAILRCTMASAIAGWIRTDLTPLAASLGSEISDLDNLDSFECRGRNGVAGAPLSEHGRANALDVRALKLANGQSIALTDRTVPRGWRESVLHSACTRFTTVLGPGSDLYHEDHIHLDLMERHNNYKICQWDVWDPLPQVAPLLPAARPDEAPPREVAAKSDAPKPNAIKPEISKSETSKSETSNPDARKIKPPPMKKRRQSRRFLNAVVDQCSTYRIIDTRCRRLAAPSAN
jgi:hypothetical protein